MNRFLTAVEFDLWLTRYAHRIEVSHLVLHPGVQAEVTPTALPWAGQDYWTHAIMTLAELERTTPAAATAWRGRALQRYLHMTGTWLPVVKPAALVTRDGEPIAMARGPRPAPPEESP